MTGTITQYSFPGAPPADYREDVAITGGTGSFTGAIGSAGLTGFPDTFPTLNAGIAWSFDVPI